MATREEVLAAFRYYIDGGGYYEKASARNLSRERSDFAANTGSANYTYMGKLCGCNPGAWCAMMVSTAVYEACGNDRSKARAMLWGRWPQYNCRVMAEDAKAAGLFYWSRYGRQVMGKSGTSYAPRAGDVIIFTDSWKSMDHTGLVYAADGTNVYTYEGNSGNMARKRSYRLDSAYIYGYCPLAGYGAQTGTDPLRALQQALGVTADGVFGPATTKAAIRAYQRALNREQGAGLEEDGVWGMNTYSAGRGLRSGDEGELTELWQRLLAARGFDPVGIDGDFGPNTAKATEAFQRKAGLSPSGQADRRTWAAMLGQKIPTGAELREGDRGQSVKYMQELLWQKGYVLETDGIFGQKTADDVADFQKSRGLEATGRCDEATWALLEKKEERA